jgi:hypothetical protein
MSYIHNHFTNRDKRLATAHSKGIKERDVVGASDVDFASNAVTGGTAVHPFPPDSNRARSESGYFPLQISTSGEQLPRQLRPFTEAAQIQ